MSNHKLIQFTNCRLIRGHELKPDHLWIRNGKIINPEPLFFQEKVLPDCKIDCKNAIIAPGYIDIQINGGYGVDFSFNINNVAESINKVAKALVTHGVTSFCPTLVTSSAETYHKILPQIPKVLDGAVVLGMHLEGPFINPQKKGAHAENSIRSINNDMETLISVYGTLENVKIVTLAPELDKTGAVTRALIEMGVVVGMGHSMATLSDAEIAVRNGAKLVTHLFNAMLPLHHRDPGLVGIIASDAIPSDHIVYFSIIADGVHVHPVVLRIAQRTHPDGLILVTDAISGLGLEEGTHHIGQLTMEIKNGAAFLTDTETLCGSIAPLDKCVRIFKKATGCSIVYAIETATLHPAKCLKIEKSKGTLEYNTDADFILLDDDLNVLSTWINGKMVYKKDECCLDLNECC